MKKQLSALMDGELDIEESEHIFTAIKSKGEVKDAWKHYHLIGDAMRGDVDMQHDFSAKVMQALDAEPTVLAINKQVTGQKSQQRKAKSPMFWSVAASAAAVMFVGLMVFELQLGESEDLSAIEIAQSLPIEYLQAHQSLAPSGSSYYIQSASYTEPQP
ncbi:MAG: sigma-E factor negative regulatory protein [Methylophilaceae bacterium]